MISLISLKVVIGLFIIFASDLKAQSPTTVDTDTLDVHKKVIMERITVTGTPERMSHVPGAATYLGSVELQRQNHTDINRILREVSGVYLQEEDGYGLRPNIGIRGAGGERSSRINIMEDGVLAAPAPYSAPAAYYFPNVARMSAVEVRKGSSQIKFGPNTTGGAINLISTPVPTEASGTAEMSIGERLSNKIYANFGKRSERFGFLLEGTHIGDNGFKKLDNEGDTGFSIMDFMSKFTLNSSSDVALYQHLELKLAYHDETSNETYLGLTKDDYKESPFRRYASSQLDQMTTEHVQLMTRHFIQISNQVDVTSTIYRNNFSRSWYKLHQLNSGMSTIGTGNLHQILSSPEDHPVEYGYLLGESSPDNALTIRNNNREYYSQGIESIVGINFGTTAVRHQLEMGIRLHQDQEDRFQEEDLYRMENGTMILTSPGIAGTQDNRIGSATALALYVQDQIELDNWIFTPGIRFENIWFRNRNYGTADVERSGNDLVDREYVFSVVVPGIGISRQVSEHLHLFTGIHRGFSPPSPRSSAETRSESSLNYELGFRYLAAAVQTEVIGFYNDYSNLLGSDLAAGGGTGTTAQFNAGEAEVYGVEVATDLELAELLNIDSTSLSLPLNVNYTFTKATFRSSFVSDFGPWGSVESGDRIPFIPEHQLNAGLHLNWRDFGTGINMVFSPGMRTIAGTGPFEAEHRTDNYFLVDLNASLKVMESVNVFVLVRNLFDNIYIVSDRPFGVRPGLPRTAMGGIRFDI